MAQPRANFGPVTRLDADAVGRPGQRAFRLLVEGEPGAACLWVERSQLEALAMLIEQLLSGLPAVQIRGSASGEAADATAGRGFSSQPDVEFRVGQLAVGFDDRKSLYVLIAHNAESESGDDPDFTCQATRAQLRALSESIPPLLAAGRPRCPMCEQPLGTGKHHCARANGHVQGEA